MCRHSLARCGDGSGCKCLDQSPGGGFPLASVGLELFLREDCLERGAKSSMGLDFPWLHGKAWRGEMYPLTAELRGMSMAGEELTEGGHPLALIVLSITLTKPSTRSSPRLTPGARGGALCWWGRFTPRRRQVLLPGGDAPQGPRRCSVELARFFASPSLCVADGALFFQTLLSFFPFVCLFLSAQPY